MLILYLRSADYTYIEFNKREFEMKCKEMAVGILLPITLLFQLSPALQAEEADWQLRRLMQPTPQERQRDVEGRIFIYDGLHEKDIHRALDTEFERVESMMFVRTRVDVANGSTEVEEDGCDD